jgi:hypothetical protein
MPLGAGLVESPFALGVAQLERFPKREAVLGAGPVAAAARRVVLAEPGPIDFLIHR